MSYQVEVSTDGKTWTPISIFLATQLEAMDYAASLFSARPTRGVRYQQQVDHPPTHRWDGKKLECILEDTPGGHSSTRPNETH